MRFLFDDQFCLERATINNKKFENEKNDNLVACNSGKSTVKLVNFCFVTNLFTNINDNKCAKDVKRCEQFISHTTILLTNFFWAFSITYNFMLSIRFD